MKIVRGFVGIIYIQKLIIMKIVGWNRNQNYVVLYLRTHYEHPTISKSMVISQRIIKKYTEVINIFALGNTPIEQTLYLIHLGDWFSYALAIFDLVDPMPIVHVDYIKNELQKII